MDTAVRPQIPAKSRRPVGATPGANADRLAELEDERRFLLRSLADLEREHDAGDVDEQDYATLKDDYTIRAATVLRSITSRRSALPARPPRRRGRMVRTIVITLAAGLTLGWLLSRYTGERRVGDTITGGATALDDTQSLLSRARSQQLTSPLDSLKLYSEVLAKEPNNVEAMTYRGWTAAILASNTQPGDAQTQFLDLASKDLASAVATNPGYIDAQCFSAIVKFRLQKDAAGAKPFYDKCASSSLPSSVGSLVSSLGADIDTALGISTTVPTGTTVPTATTSPAAAASTAAAAASTK